MLLTPHATNAPTFRLQILYLKAAIISKSISDENRKCYWHHISCDKLCLFQSTFSETARPLFAPSPAQWHSLTWWTTLWPSLLRWGHSQHCTFTGYQDIRISWESTEQIFWAQTFDRQVQSLSLHFPLAMSSTRPVSDWGQSTLLDF